MIKLISFDFWDTLFKGDPRHSAARVEYLSNVYDLDPEFVKKTISETKKWCDEKGVETLTCISPGTQLYFLGKNLGIPDFPVSEIRDAFTELLTLYPPICLISKDTIESIRNEGIRCCISCNTGFMGYPELQWILIESELNSLFDFKIFSERIRYFKPHPFWTIPLKQGWFDATRSNDIKNSQILHVGDNDLTDGQLCRNTGMYFMKVEPKNPDFSGIFEIIEKEKNG